MSSKQPARPRYPRAPRITITVTSDIIAAACKRDSSHCMIAEALKLVVPGTVAVSVDLQTIRYSDPKKRLRYSWLTPRPAQEALIDFDQGNPDIADFTFQLANGHVTRMSYDRKTVKLRGLQKNSKKSRVIRAEPSQHQKTLQKVVNLSAAEKAALQLPASTVLAPPDMGSIGGGSVPRLVGGNPPPLGPLARKRTFGLRGLRR